MLINENIEVIFDAKDIFAYVKDKLQKEGLEPVVDDKELLLYFTTDAIAAAIDYHNKRITNPNCHVFKVKAKRLPRHSV